LSSIAWRLAFRFRMLGGAGLALSWFLVIALLLALGFSVGYGLRIARGEPIRPVLWHLVGELVLVTALAAIGLAVLGLNPTKDADQRAWAAGELLNRLREEDLARLHERIAIEPDVSWEYTEVVKRQPGQAYRAHLDRVARELGKGHWNAPVNMAMDLLARERQNASG
ncbi:MAG: hypothetical protein L0I24_25355, partial [Pseudonocardia sp.]|nr:hypothetical protein [Pseudonocardia sp.]